MDEIGDAAPCGLVFGGVKAGQPGVIRPSGETQVISAQTSPAPPTAREV